MKSVWAITDHRPGTASQVIGVAQALTTEWTDKPLDYRLTSRLPNGFLTLLPLRAIIRNRTALMNGPAPQIIISAGRRSAPVARAIKHRHPSVKLVHLMHPNLPLQHFDLIVLPTHDRPPPHSNIMATLGAPHKVNDAILYNARETAPLVPDSHPTPHVMLCIGGNTSHGDFSLNDMEQCLRGSCAMLNAKGTLLLTTSRRTPHIMMRHAREILTHDYPDITVDYYHSEHGGINPYFAWLAQADIIVVTGDSVSMVSEAAYLGKPVYVYSPTNTMSRKHHHFITDMQTRGHVKLLSAYDQQWTGGAKLDEASRIAERIRTL